MTQWTVGWQKIKHRWGTWRSPPHLVLLDDIAAGTDDEAALQAFERWCAAHAGSVCHLGLSSRWMLLGVQDGAQAHGEALDQAQSTWVHYLDLDTASFQQDWVVRASLIEGSWLFCALPAPLLARLHALARTHAVQLRWVGPWWAKALATCCQTLERPQQEGVTHCLQMAEPLVWTGVRLQSDASGAWRLARIWIEWGAPSAPPAPTSTQIRVADLLVTQAHGVEFGAPHLWQVAA